MLTKMNSCVVSLFLPLLTNKEVKGGIGDNSALFPPIPLFNEISLFLPQFFHIYLI